jgi:GntR family transcriptional regulator
LHADTEVKVLEKGPVHVPADIALRLELPEVSMQYRFVRVRHFEGAPLSYVETYVPIDIGERLARLDLRRSSIMTELRDTLKVSFTELTQTIEAVAADAGVAQSLDVPVGTPLLLINRLLHLDHERPMLFRSHFRSDRYFYTVQLQGAAASKRAAGKPQRRKSA